MKKITTRMLVGILTVVMLCSILAVGAIASKIEYCQTSYLNPEKGMIDYSSAYSFPKKGSLLWLADIEAIAGPATIWFQNENSGKSSSKADISTNNMGSTVPLSYYVWGGEKTFVYRLYVKNRYSHNNPMSIRWGHN